MRELTMEQYKCYGCSKTPCETPDDCWEKWREMRRALVKEGENYYTPDLEDISVGYEYEWKTAKGWRRSTMETLPDYWDTGYRKYSLNQMLEFGLFRTKFLDEADLEKEGWEFITNDLGFPEYYRRGAFNLIPRKDNFYQIAKVTFKDSEEYSNSRPSYTGKIKSINELRRISRWLKL